MLKWIRAVALSATLLLTPVAGHAQEASTAFVPILYKVSDRDNAMYVLGSIHQQQAGRSQLPPVVQRAFDAAQVTVYELKPEDFRNDATELLKQIQAQGFLPPEQSLAALLDADTLARVRTRMAEMKIDESNWQRMKPWYAGMLLQLATLQKMGLKSEHGVDLQLIDRGIAAQKQQDGLETIAEQISVLSSTPLDVQARELGDQLDPSNNLSDERQTAVLLKAYAEGNIRTFESILRQMRRHQPSTYKALIENRNLRWIPRLKLYLDDRSEGDVMVIVGALHVVGPNGIVTQLRKAGYKVERVTR